MANFQEELQKYTLYNNELEKLLALLQTYNEKLQSAVGEYVV